VLIRTTRSVGLTEPGARFFAHAQPAFEAMLAASDSARGLAKRPSGLLRLAVPRAVVPLILEPIIAAFCAAHPEATIEIAASEELIDLAKDGFDAGVCMGQFIAEDMVTVRLSPPFRLMFVASPTYLSRMGNPERPDALRNHACIRIRRSSGAIGDWQLIDDGRPVEMTVTAPMVAMTSLPSSVRHWPASGWRRFQSPLRWSIWHRVDCKRCCRAMRQRSRACSYTSQSAARSCPSCARSSRT
jgi:DNA-binding transcriptional LysR family regulator